MSPEDFDDIYGIKSGKEIRETVKTIIDNFYALVKEHGNVENDAINALGNTTFENHVLWELLVAHNIVEVKDIPILRKKILNLSGRAEISENIKQNAPEESSIEDTEEEAEGKWSIDDLLKDLSGDE